MQAQQARQQAAEAWRSAQSKENGDPAARLGAKQAKQQARAVARDARRAAREARRHATQVQLFNATKQ